MKTIGAENSVNPVFLPSPKKNKKKNQPSRTLPPPTN